MSRASNARRWFRTAIQLACRLILGGLFFVSAIDKVENPAGFGAALDSYHLLPSDWTGFLVPILVALEMLLALLLLSGLWLRAAAIATAAVMLVYTMAIAVNLKTGNTAHACGCFQVSTGSSWPWLQAVLGGSTITWVDLARDIILLLLALILLVVAVPVWGMERMRSLEGNKNGRDHNTASSQTKSVRFMGRTAYAASSLIALVIALATGGFSAEKLLASGPAPIAKVSDYTPGKSTLQPGTRAPGFILKTLAKKPYTLHQFRGKVVLLEFFALWCPYCQQMAPVLASVNEQFHDEPFQLLSIVASPYSHNLETSHYTNLRPYTRSDVLWYVHTFHVVTPILLDPDFRVTNTYGIPGYPVLILVDAHGIIQKVIDGPTSRAKLVATVQQYLPK